MTADPVVTGFGVFTAFGFGEQPLLDGVFAGRAAFREVTRFDPARFRTRHAATCPGADTPGQYETFLACARAALAMAGIDRPAAMPVLVGTKGDFTAITRFAQSTEDGALAADRGLPAHLPDRVASELGLGRPRLAFANACVASADAIAHAGRLIRAGRADAVLCGGAYLVDEEVFAKFDGMYAMAADGQVRPFCNTRSGLLLGDGVAALVVESAEHARARGAEPIAKLSGWAVTDDAYHVVQPHPEGIGMARAICEALRRAGAGTGEVDYVNAHGTGTPANDVAETLAIRRALGEHADATPVSSTKSTIGHQLEAAGAVQAVIAMLALRHGVIPPTAGYAEPDPRCDLDCVPNQPRTAALERAITMSASFGGINAVLVLERP